MSNFVRGVFIEECKNRFLCLVKIKKEEHLCYVASSARLSNFVDLANKKVLLIKNKGIKTRTAYTLYAVKGEFGYIVLNLSEANTLLLEVIRKEYSSNISIQKEKFTLEGYKADHLVVSVPPTIVEVKSILADKTAVRFPSVNGERSIRQLEALEEALLNGYQVRYCLVLLSSYIDNLTLDVSAADFNTRLKKCVDLGMSLETYRLKVTRKLRFFIERDSQLENSILRNEVLLNVE
ncbi:DNA/RNA nuclease SfsA [Paenibacillus athensensis]|uniref:Sugar fermentation stimulation protein C-terminal domain-containing protein n=1 Tax=Paenibacillus athensensis TaxID=1967502 RepID=A0A4Y8PZR5_9BACL|nr:DNA/RNA nuclease SfsA [Paenibacillus athensensis]MCD1261379.1 DNA/RNA nuclease SfsA [Paenibacillus athensensis]